MSPIGPADSKEDQQLGSAEHGKVRQNPQPPRNQNSPDIDSSDKEESEGGGA
jgi:hypothetical protein